LWFATQNGAALVDPKLFTNKETPPRAIVESVKADGRMLVADQNGRVRIPAGSGHALEFRFTACDLAAPEQVRFSRRLAGVDRDWSEPSPERGANYFNLWPGSHRLEVRALDHHGGESAAATLEFIIEPSFWQTRWFYVSCGGGVAFIAAGAGAYRLRWRRRVAQLERQRAVAGERARIARDLHDDLGTALTGMALNLDVLGREAETNSPLVRRLASAAQHARRLAEQMREVVWTVNPRCDNLRSLADFLEDQAGALLEAAGVRVRLEFPLDIPEMPMAANVRHQVALSVREAFTNIVRHSRATEAGVQLRLSESELVLSVQDNGRGFDPAPRLEKPRGLHNLKSRMEEIGGSFHCQSAPGRGTEITFALPLSKLQSGGE
jgi:signal transduction histidine kinase